jgi:hypothetical protein
MEPQFGSSIHFMSISDAIELHPIILIPPANYLMAMA